MGRVTIPSIIDRNAIVDETENLQDFFNSQPDGTCFDIPSGADYRIDSPLEFDLRNGFTFNGLGDTPRFGAWTDGTEYSDPLHREQFKFTRCNDFNMYNLRIKGGNPFAGTSNAAYVLALESQHGIKLQGVHKFLGDRIWINDVHGDYVYIGEYVGDYSTDIYFRNFDWQRNGRQGLAVVAGANVCLQDGYMGENRRAAVDLEPNNPTIIRDIRIKNVTFGPTRLLKFANGGDVNCIIEDILWEDTYHIGQTSNDFAVSRLNMSFGNPTINDGKRARYTIRRGFSGNDDGGPAEASMSSFHVDDVVIEYCYQVMESGRNMHMLRIGYTDRAKVRFNWIPRGTAGIRFDGAGQNFDYCSGWNRCGDAAASQIDSTTVCV